MSRLLAALGVSAGAVVLTLLIILIGSINIFGPLALYMLMFVTAVASLAFSFWLQSRGELIGQPTHVQYAKYLRRTAYVMLLAVVLRYKLPDLAPQTFAYLGSLYSSVEHSAGKSALERAAPQPVEPGPVLIGAKGETLYWWHPCDQPAVFYDRGGEHPQGCGALQPVTPAVAQLMRRLHLQAKAEPPPAPPPDSPSVPLPQPATPPQGAWLSVPQPQ